MLDTKLAIAISKREGWGIPGDLPTRNNNPGDLRHAPGEMHPANAPDSVGSFKTPEEGWAALERQLIICAGRNETVQQLVGIYAPPNENDTGAYLDYVCKYVGCSPDTLVSDALKIT